MTAGGYGFLRSQERQKYLALLLPGRLLLLLLLLRVEQLFDLVDFLGKPRPFTRELVLGALGSPDARRLLDRTCNRHRHLFGLSRRRKGWVVAQRHLLQVLGWRRLRLLLFGRQRRGDVVAPLPLEVGGILFVDFFLLFRRRIGACNVEGAVLHEVVVGVAATGLAAAGELRVAFGQLRRLFFLGCRLLGHIGAGFEIDRRAAPPLRVAAHRSQHDEASDGGDSKRRST